MALTALAIGAIAAPVVGGIMGNMMSSSAKKKADQAIQKALAELKSINLPDTEKMKLALESPEVQGILQPYMQQAEQLASTAQEQITTDPRLRQAQMQALETMSKMGTEGLTATDRAALNQARRQTAGDEQARQASILQNMAQRGVGGSGMELAAKLSSSQESADRASQESDRTMAMAQQRMLAAISGAGELGGQIRGQEYGEQSDLARARDAIAQFNLQQRAATQSANVGQLNEAQLRNLAEKQRVSEAGVSTRNRQQEYNKQLEQQRFNNEMQLKQAIANAQLGQAGSFQAQARDTAGMWQGIGSGVGTGLMGAATMMSKQPAGTPVEKQPVDTMQIRNKLGENMVP